MVAAAAMVALGASATSQAATLTLIGGSTNNGDFEIGSGLISGGSVTSWATWTEQSTADNNTGIHTAGPVGPDQNIYIQGGGAIRNITTHTAAIGDTFEYGFTDAYSEVNITMQLIYNDGGTWTAITGSDLTEEGGGLGNRITSRSDSFTVQAGDAWVGKTIGVGLFSTGGFPNIDDVNLSVTAVPEPSSAALLGIGGIALILRRKK